MLGSRGSPLVLPGKVKRDARVSLQHANLGLDDGLRFSKRDREVRSIAQMSRWD
jgi:hypothetical protein